MMYHGSMSQNDFRFIDCGVVIGIYSQHFIDSGAVIPTLNLLALQCPEQKNVCTEFGFFGKSDDSRPLILISSS